MRFSNTYLIAPYSRIYASPYFAWSLLLEMHTCQLLLPTDTLRVWQLSRGRRCYTCSADFNNDWGKDAEQAIASLEEHVVCAMIDLGVGSETVGGDGFRGNDVVVFSIQPDRPTVFQVLVDGALNAGSIRLVALDGGAADEVISHLGVADV